MSADDLIKAGFNKRRADAIVASMPEASVGTPLWVAKFRRSTTESTPGLAPWSDLEPVMVLGADADLAVGSEGEGLENYLDLGAEGVYSAHLHVKITWDEDPGWCRSNLNLMEQIHQIVRHEGDYWLARYSLATGPELYEDTPTLLLATTEWENNTVYPVGNLVQSLHVARWV